jgi:four helix bundle protein
MNRQELEERLIKFAVSAIEIAERFPNSITGKHLGSQLIRSTSSMALNYAEAQGAESRKDFRHKIKIVLKESRESHVCLQIIHKKGTLIKNSSIEPVLDEANQLVSIFVKMAQKLDDE